MGDLTKEVGFNEKKGSYYACAKIKHEMIETTDPYILYNIPANCLVTKVIVVPEERGQSGLRVTLRRNGAIMGINNALVSSSVIRQGVNLRFLTGDSEEQISATFNSVPTTGIFHVLVEFIEFTESLTGVKNMKVAD